MEEKKCVLAVDDDILILMELIHILKADYKVRSVKDGNSALENVSEYIPDIILLDVNMPDMNGYEVVQELRKSERTNKIPVILITGAKMYEDYKRQNECIVDYIRKPFNAEEVKQKVKMHLG